MDETERILSVVKRSIDCGFSIEKEIVTEGTKSTKKFREKSLLDTAIDLNSSDIVKILLDNGANIDETYLSGGNWDHFYSELLTAIDVTVSADTVFNNGPRVFKGGTKIYEYFSHRTIPVLSPGRSWSLTAAT